MAGLLAAAQPGFLALSLVLAASFVGIVSFLERQAAKRAAEQDRSLAYIFRSEP